MMNVGVLLLHGFTSSLDTVNGLVPSLEAAGVSYRMPVLRGHGQTPEALRGVTWRDWVEDARAALLDLEREGNPIVIVGLSMGGLVALNLAAEHPSTVAGVATVAACLEFRHPLIPYLGLLKKTVKNWSSSPDYADASLARYDTNYPYFPLESFASLYEYREVVKEILPYLKAPLLVIQSTQDPVVRLDAAEQIRKKSGSPFCQVRWFEVSRHEMMRDVERNAVFDELMDFLSRVVRSDFEPARVLPGEGAVDALLG
jgi:carboxylesterase